MPGAVKEQRNETEATEHGHEVVACPRRAVRTVEDGYPVPDVMEGSADIALEVLDADEEDAEQQDQLLVPCELSLPDGKVVVADSEAAAADLACNPGSP